MITYQLSHFKCWPSASLIIIFEGYLVNFINLYAFIIMLYYIIKLGNVNILRLDSEFKWK